MTVSELNDVFSNLEQELRDLKYLCTKDKEAFALAVESIQSGLDELKDAFISVEM